MNCQLCDQPGGPVLKPRSNNHICDPRLQGLRSYRLCDRHKCSEKNCKDVKMERVPPELQGGNAETLLKRCLYHAKIHFKRTFAGGKSTRHPAASTSNPAAPPKIDLEIAGDNMFDNDIRPEPTLAPATPPAVLSTRAAATPSSIYLFTVCPLTDNAIEIHENLWIALPNTVPNNKRRLVELLNDSPDVQGCENVRFDPSPRPWLRLPPAILCEADNYQIVRDCARGNQQQALGCLTFNGLGENLLSRAVSNLSRAYTNIPIDSDLGVDEITSFFGPTSRLTASGYLLYGTTPADMPTTTDILVESGTILAFWERSARLLQRDDRLALPPDTKYCIYSVEPTLTTTTLNVNPQLYDPEPVTNPATNPPLILIGVCLSLLSDLHTTWLRSNTHRVKTWLQPWRARSSVVDATWSFVRELEKEMRIEEIIRSPSTARLPLSSFFQTPNPNRDL